METLLLLKLKKLVTNKWFWITLVILVSVGYGFTQHQLYLHQKEQAKQWKANFQTMQVRADSSLDLLGRKQYEVKQLQFSTHQFKQELENKNTQLHKYLVELQASKVKINQLTKFINANISSHNAGTTIIYDTIIDSLQQHQYSFQVNDGYLVFNATWKVNDSVNWNYQYKEKIYVWSTRQRDQFTKKGKKRFFLARWFVPRWKTQVHIKSNNPRSNIKALQINLTK